MQLALQCRVFHFRSNGTSVITEICLNNSTPCVRPVFQGHSRSSDPTRIDRLSIDVRPFGASGVSEINGDSVENRNFSLPICVFNAPAERVPLEIAGNGTWVQKQDSCMFT